MRSARRVAITGIGIISSQGRGRSAVIEALREGRSGVRRLTSIDPSPLNCQIGGEVPPADDEAEHRGFDRFTRFALIAAGEAAEQARFEEGDFDRERVSVLIGTGLGGCTTTDDGYRRVYREQATRIPPMSIAASMYNAAASAVSTRFGAKGTSYAVVSACASSAHSIGLAAQAVRAGSCDAVFAGGTDAPLVYGIIRAWESMRILSIDNEHPERACRPFDATRQGLVLAEGAAVLFLESFESAERRSQPILGEILGFGATSDAGHVTDPSSDGAARAMSLSLGDAGLVADDVRYVNAHGTGTRANDVIETKAIREVFGPAANNLAVSSTKSMHGHAMGASGAIEIAGSLLALNEGFIPPTINLEHRDPECDLDYTPLRARDLKGPVAFLSNSFGFGGMNAVVAVGSRGYKM